MHTLLGWQQLFLNDYLMNFDHLTFDFYMLRYFLVEVVISLRGESLAFLDNRNLFSFVGFIQKRLHVLRLDW